MIRIFPTFLVAGIVLLQGCLINPGGTSEHNMPPVVDAGNDKAVFTSKVKLNSRATDPDSDELVYNWEFVNTPQNSFAKLLDADTPSPSFIADWRGIYHLKLTVSDDYGNSSVDQVLITRKDGEIVDAWKDLQEEIDRERDGASIELESDKVYVLHSGISLRDYSNIKIIGNGATIRRIEQEKTSTYLARDYIGGTEIEVESVPENYKVGEKLAIATGNTVNEVTLNPRTIIEINSNSIELNYPFYGEYKAGATVFKSFYLLSGLPSSIDGGSNPGTIIQGVIFDGNSMNNTINYGWPVNGTIYLQGGKTSEIKSNHFFDISNENIVGHGVNVYENEFDGLNGSALHTSLHDKTKDLNARSNFSNNIVFNPNRMEKYVNGHSEGAITFSWGGGNLAIEDNVFISKSRHYGVMGIFAGAKHHTDENLTFKNNYAKNFENIITIISPESSPTKNILITENSFYNVGYNDFSEFYGNSTIRIGCNEAMGDTAIVVDRNNSSCK